VADGRVVLLRLPAAAARAQRGGACASSFIRVQNGSKAGRCVCVLFMGILRCVGLRSSRERASWNQVDFESASCSNQGDFERASSTEALPRPCPFRVRERDGQTDRQTETERRQR
jgi:hypothetical protein